MALYRRENARILGRHDGASIHVGSDTLASPAVQMHEAVHDLIFNRTPDGTLHRFCCLAANTPHDVQNGGVYANLARFLFEDTRFAHEAAATYMGIQGLRPEDQRRELETLSSDYREYYDRMAALLNPLSDRSWRRHALAWAFAHWCFSSMRCIRFFAVEEPDAGTVEQIASPSQRMTRAIAALQERGDEWRDAAKAGARQTCEPRGAELLDLSDAEMWEVREAGGADFEAVMTQLQYNAGYWLLDNLSFESDDWRNLPEPGIGLRKLAEALNFRVRHGHLDAQSDRNANPFIEEGQARARARDTVEHAPICPVHDLTGQSPKTLMDAVRACVPSSSDVFFLSDADASDEHMFILFRRRLSSEPPDDAPDIYRDVGSFRVPSEWALRMAQAFLGTKGEGGLPNLRMWVMVSAGRDDLESAISRCLSHAVDLSGAEVRGPPVPPEQLALYWRDDWIRIHDLPDVAVAWAGVALAESGERDQAKRLAIRFARSPARFPGYIISAKTPLAGDTIEAFEQRKISAGSLSALQLPEGPGDVSPALAPFLVAWEVWDRF